MLWLFALAVLIIVAAINIVVLLVFGIAAKPGTGEQQALIPTLVASSAITLTVIGLGSLFKTLSLRGGGGAVARSMGGTLVPEDPRDFHLKRLRNVVEEMSIASGVPVPEIYVLDRESGINAFAAGYSGSDAAIAVTRGALDRLSRDELQGVIAHEFSHILNGDMRLNIRLMGLLFGVLVIGLIVIGWHYFLYARLIRDTALPRPARIAATAVSRLPCPVSTTTGRSGRISWTRVQSSIPCISLMPRSVTTTAKSPPAIWSSASWGEVVVVTRKPAVSSPWETSAQAASSSSTKRM